MWSLIEDENAALYQVQVDHANVRPSVTFDIVGNFNSFLKQLNQEDGGIPGSLSDLGRHGIKLVLTNGEDPDQQGCFVQYRAAFYIAGKIDALRNFMYLLDVSLLYNLYLDNRDKSY